MQSRVESKSDKLEKNAQETFDRTMADLRHQKAEAAASYVGDKFGIEPVRLVTSWYGESNPVAPNDTDQGRALNSAGKSNQWKASAAVFLFIVVEFVNGFFDALQEE